MSWGWYATYGKEEKIPAVKNWDPVTGELVVKKTKKSEVKE